MESILVPNWDHHLSLQKSQARQWSIHNMSSQESSHSCSITIYKVATLRCKHIWRHLTNIHQQYWQSALEKWKSQNNTNYFQSHTLKKKKKKYTRPFNCPYCKLLPKWHLSSNRIGNKKTRGKKRNKTGLCKLYLFPLDWILLIIITKSLIPTLKK